MSKNVLQKALGISAAADARGSLLTVGVDRAGLERILAHVLQMAPAERPRLRGIDAVPQASGRIALRVAFVIEGLPSFLCVEADLSGDEALPDFRTAWPYANWWQEEIAAFSPLSFGMSIEGGALSWRRA